MAFPVKVYIRTKDGKFLVRDQPDKDAAVRYISDLRLRGLCEPELYIHQDEIRQLEIAG